MRSKPIRCKQNSPARSRSERGAVLLVVVFVTIGLLFLCALAIGLGFVQTSKGKFQNNVNLAALGALAAFVETTGDATAKMYQADLRAEAVLTGNPVQGAAQALGELGTLSAPGPSGFLEYGQWFVRDTTGLDPCGGEYPCFLAVDPLTQPVNAVRLRANTQEGNGIQIFFGNLLSTSTIGAAAQATATLVERCTAYLLDVSPSVHADTHIYSSINSSTMLCDDPRCSYPFFPEAAINAAVANPALCADFSWRNAGSALQRRTRATWCTMEEQRLGSPPDPIKHFRSDYRLVQSRAGNFYVDSYFDSYTTYFAPQPFGDLFLAFNAALTAVREQSSANDKALVAAFSGVIRSQEPDTGLTSELDRLIQLTNVNFRGLVKTDGTEQAPIFPNFLDKNWMPVIGSSSALTQTNLVTPLERAIQTLANSDLCSPTAQKSIILATDGIASCFRTGPQFSSNPPDCGYDWPHYFTSEQQLIGDTESVLTQLQQQQIRLTVLHTGDAAGPNFINRVENGEYIDSTKAQAFGYTGFPDQSYTTNPDQFFDISSTDRHGDAWDPENDPNFRNQMSHGAIFRRPVGVLGKLAIESGGIYAPLLARRPASACGGGACYICPNGQPSCAESEKILDPVYREADTPQTFAIQNLSKGEQAARAATQTVGGNPYILVEEVE